MKPLTADQVTRLVDSDPDTLYRIVSDVTRTPEWSPEVVAVRWEDGPDGDEGPVAGARFTATNRRRWLRWTNHPVVVTAETGRVFAFSRTERGGGTMRWTYQIDRVNSDQSRLTLGYEVTAPVPTSLHVILKVLFRVDDLEGDLHQNMAQSLERIAALAAASAPQRPV
ncbi:polyketide cyclase [Intrasporangium oryzae NRRL B-24470]|uniref:Polyketide cyclase n=1 Tax=Intrasporangium oryzae NRRL B-24470 TaxID=1386089 RepID=W9GHL7_9MICO|nr:SRPBCC family protein [Intrasporangium oryzae]EWT03384.1 polyketide cyclase [Intrasporangium oryzae NRRL B-24470]